MKHIRAMLVGAALLTGTATFASAQALVPVQWGYQRDNDDRQAFRDGYQQGQWDARHNRRFDPGSNRWRGDDRDAYRAGYERGFRESGGGPGFVGGGGYGGYGLNSARQNGFQDGINDGVNDRRTGHSNRPTHGDNYKHADRGYNSGYGNKNYFKQEYREAYYKGYEQGYNSNVYERR
jgi:hypothetical protein